MKVIVYYPTSEADIASLKQKVSNVHAQAVARHIKNLSCPKEQKEELINSIK